MTIEGLGELGLLERIKPYLAAGAGGDDAAVLADATGFVVASTDMFVEDVHFDFGWMSAEDVGWRSLALALGDLAAKGAQPLWALTSIAMPNRWTVEQMSDGERARVRAANLKTLRDNSTISVETNVIYAVARKV